MTMQDDRNLLVFTGNANRPLADEVCRQLGVRPGRALVGRFSDGEVQVEIEENVRGQDVFVLQPTCAPSAENLVELLVLIDALKRASVASGTAVVPYFGYARQDRRPRSARVPITAKVAAQMFSTVHTDRVLTVDLHADQIQGFFDIPVDNVYSSPLLLADIWRNHGTKDMVVVSPDVGGVLRARAIAKRLDDADLAIIDKRRPKANVATVMNIIGDTTTMSFVPWLRQMSASNSGEEYTLSTGMSKKPWICSACRSMVSTRSVRTVENICAATLAVIGTRAERGRRSWRA